MLKFVSFLMTAMTLISNFFGVNMKITVTHKALQDVNGFGTSACWWAQMIDDPELRTYLSRELYSTDGLALNIYRYNIGGGINPDRNRIHEKSRQTESFYYFNEESGKYEYDFSRDANAMAMLKESLSYGCVDTVVLFANSPHYSMTINGETAGSVAGVSNILEDRYADFVDYFLTITDHFINEGIPVKYISPVNEPQWDWGGDWVGQEGCHYDTDQLIKLLELFAKELDARKLDVKLMVPESGEIGKMNDEYFDLLGKNKIIAPKIGSYAYHSYWSDTSLKKKLEFGIARNKNIKNASVDMTEWCELPCSHDVNDIDAALLMARVIANDFYFENCNSWSNWVAVNHSGNNSEGKNLSDGLFYSTDRNYDEVRPTVRYAALAHFSRFIPTGSVLLQSYSNIMDKSSEDENNYYYPTSFAAFRTPERKTVIVIVNEGQARKINLAAGIAKQMEVFTTDTERRLEKTYNGKMKLSINVGEKSITTIIMK